MIIASALYYPSSLDSPQGLVRDSRYYPAKSADCFPIWWQYLRKHYPDTKVVLFADSASPVPIGPLLRATINEPWWEEFNGGDTDVAHHGATMHNARVQVDWVNQFSGQYFRPMQRNLVEAICLAYRTNEDLFWLDNDAFLNTDIRTFARNMDVVAARIAHHQMTMDSICFYLSKERLHALDGFGIDLPAYLTTMLNTGPVETRMHSLQEGGLYKTFCYGKTRCVGQEIELSHLSCYPNFMTFLRRNPLDTPEYCALVSQLESLDMSRLNGVDIAFPDMLCPEEPS